ncbi:MAG: hypothetical protein NT141_00795 [candidate division WWE3 bacterium]|nr:hypothetical protein [candidate division WWE3 bacterium]
MTTFTLCNKDGVDRGFRKKVNIEVYRLGSGQNLPVAFALASQVQTTRCEFLNGNPEAAHWFKTVQNFKDYSDYCGQILIRPQPELAEPDAKEVAVRFITRVRKLQGYEKLLILVTEDCCKAFTSLGLGQFFIFPLRYGSVESIGKPPQIFADRFGTCLPR